MRQFIIEENGLTAVLLPWPCKSVAASIGIRTGSSNDPCELDSDGKSLHGFAHLFEHCFSRASRKWPSWHELCRHADGFCSAFNAATDQQTIILYAETKRRRAGRLVDFLSDVTLHPLFWKRYVGNEQERVCEEKSRYNDDPDSRVEDDTYRLLYGTTGMGHPILGYEDAVRHITPRQLWGFHKRRVTGRNLVMAVAGGFDPDHVEQAIRSIFRGLRPGTIAPVSSLHYEDLRGGIKLRRMEYDEIHCGISFPTFGVNDPRRVALSILKNDLSSRSSSVLRDRLDSLGYGYSIRDLLMCYRDVGLISWDIIISPGKFQAMMEIVRDIFRERCRDLLAAADLDLAKTNLSVEGSSKFDQPLEAANFITRQLINAGAYTPLPEFQASVERVTRQQIRSIARTILAQKRLVLIAHGPVNGLRVRDIRGTMRWKHV